MQLRLFTTTNPLSARFGRDFFRRIPQTPGVYLMSGTGERVLYVGKAINLRRRLASYKYAQPERAGRKVIRLIHAVRTITWEVCDSGAQALLRENELLRLFKPKFNQQNTRPEHYAYVGLRQESTRLHLRLTKQPAAMRGERLYGAFKGLPLARSALAGLGRLFWIIEHRDVTRLPAGGLRAGREQVTLDFVEVGSVSRWLAALDQWLAGESDGLCESLAGGLPRDATVNRFQGSLQAYDLESLRSFYAAGPCRTRAVQKQFELAEPLIAQAALDDWLVLTRSSGV